MLKSLEDTIQYSHMAKRLISEKSTAKAIRFIYYFYWCYGIALSVVSISIKHLILE